MVLEQTPAACPVCGSPDRACAGGHAGDTIHPLDIPSTATRRYTGPVVVALALNAAGKPYRIRIREDEALERGLEIVDPPPAKATPTPKRRSTAKDKARRQSSAGDKATKPSDDAPTA